MDILNPRKILAKITGSNIRHAESVSPDDTADMPGVSTYGGATSLYVGIGGDVTLQVGTEEITFQGLAGGMWHPMPPFERILTSTTAELIVVGY